jgi:hypothetical protein
MEDSRISKKILTTQKYETLGAHNQYERTSILFKTTEQTTHGLIHDDDDDYTYLLTKLSPS